MSVESRAAQGAVGYAAWLYTHGHNYQDILGRLERRFPGEAGSTYNALWTRGLNAAAAGRELGQLDPYERQTAAQIGGQVTGWRRFLYTVTYQQQNLTTGARRNVSEQVTSDRTLSRDELTRLVMNFAPPEDVNYFVGRGLHYRNDTIVAAQLQILSVERTE